MHLTINESSFLGTEFAFVLSVHSWMDIIVSELKEDVKRRSERRALRTPNLGGKNLNR